MQTLSSVGLSQVPFGFAMKVPSETVPPTDNASEEIDGCDVQVEVATRDEDLPAAEGGIA